MFLGTVPVLVEVYLSEPVELGGRGALCVQMDFTRTFEANESISLTLTFLDAKILFYFLEHVKLNSSVSTKNKSMVNLNSRQIF